MRVIGGRYRSRRIQSLKGLALRPTPDRLREALFNVLAPRLPGATFLDAYAGCGSVGIEAISRGAAQVVFIEKDRAAVRRIRENLRSLGITTGFRILAAPAGQRLGGVSADIVFLDPPYPLDKEYDTALATLAAQPPPLVVVQHDARRELNESYGALRRVRKLRQGDNVLSFFEPAGDTL